MNGFTTSYPCYPGTWSSDSLFNIHSKLHYIGPWMLEYTPNKVNDLFLNVVNYFFCCYCFKILLIDSISINSTIFMLFSSSFL